MHKYVIMGVQGCGKGTQAQLLANEFDLVHISVGDIFRWHIQHHSKLGAQVKRIVASGNLVNDELVGDIVRRRLDEHDWNYGFILDGFRAAPVRPRFSWKAMMSTPSFTFMCLTRLSVIACYLDASAATVDWITT